MAPSNLIPYVNTGDFVERARQVIALRRSPRTREAYNEDLDRWLTFCVSMHVNPAAPTALALTTFRDHLVASHATSSVRRILAALSSTYGGLVRLGGGVKVNPFHSSVLPWPEASMGGKTTAVSEDDAEAMIAVCVEDATPAGLRDAAVLRLLYDTGLRRASVAGLLRAGLRREGSRDLLRVVIKGGQEVEVALPPQTAEAIDAWLEIAAPESPYVFPARGGKHLHVNLVNQIVTDRAQQAGVEHVHPHMFRAAFVTAGYDAGLPEHEIQASVHHADPKITRTYDRRSRGLGVADAVAKARKKRGGK